MNQQQPPSPERLAEVSTLLRRVGVRHDIDAQDLVVPGTARGFQITEKILVSHWVPAFNSEFLDRFGVKSILGLDGKLRPDMAQHLGVDKVVAFNMPDGKGTTPQMICSLVADLKMLVEQHSPVLVHCNAGKSRSPSVVAAYLTMHEGMALSEALSLVRTARAPERSVSYHEETLSAIRSAMEER